MAKKDNTNALQVIAEAAKAATQAISTAALEATKVLASNAQEASKVVNVASSIDHDLLIRLETKMEGLKNDIAEIKNGTATQLNDHEVRINSLETSKTKQNTMMSIGIGLLSLLVTLLTYHLIK